MKCEVRTSATEGAEPVERLEEGRPGDADPRCASGPQCPLSPPLGELVRRFKHLHQEGVDGRVADQFEEEQVLQAL